MVTLLHRCDDGARHLLPLSAEFSLTVDHVHPWSKGGATCLDNGKMLCGGDNLAKGDRLPDDLANDADEN